MQAGQGTLPNTLERLRDSLDLSVREWASMLEVTERAYRSQLSGASRITLEQSVIESLADELEITPEAIMTGDIDFSVVAKRRVGLATALPERFAKSAYSKVRTSSHLLDYIEMHLGWRARSQVLRRFQLNDSIFADLDYEINVLFISELCERLHREGMPLESFYEMGKLSVISNLNGSLSTLFSKEPGPKSLYERCFNELISKYYDRNFDYRLASLGDDRCVVFAKPREQVLDELRLCALGNSATCAARAGTFASLTGYLGLPDAEVIESECIHRGGSHCRYDIDFHKARHHYLAHRN